MQYILFLIFIVSVLTCGSVYIGPLSLRVYMTILMLIYLLANLSTSRSKQLKIRTDYMGYFIVCIVTLGLSLMLNGGFEAYDFIHRSLAFYLVCIVSYYAVDACVTRPKQIDKLILVLALISVLDSIVTILQFQNNTTGWMIGSIFSNIEEFSGFLDEHDTFEGVSKLPGIFGHPVSNGFYLAVVSPLLLARFNWRNVSINTLLHVMIIIVNLIALYYLQQRAAFYLLILTLVYHFLRDEVKHPVRVVFLLLLGMVVFYIAGPALTDGFETSRLSVSDNSTRYRVWGIAVSVVFDNPLFGNLLEYNKYAEYSAHNCFLDSLVNSGIFGFIPLFVFYSKTVIDSSRIMLNSHDIYSRVFSYSVLISMAMGLFHNTSFMTGDVLIFICLACMFKAQKIDNLSRA